MTIKTSRLAVALLLTGSLAACASYGSWRPVVDSANEKNFQKLEQDFVECRSLAQQAADALSGGAQGAAIGALGGAAGGAILGAITGVPATGAALGAAAGAAGGGTTGALTAEAEFKRAYSNCMRQRGHAVIN